LVREFLARFFGECIRVSSRIEGVKPDFEFTKDWKEVSIETFGTICEDSFIGDENVINDQGEEES